MLQADLLQGDNLAGINILCLVYNTIRSFSKLF